MQAYEQIEHNRCFFSFISRRINIVSLFLSMNKITNQKQCRSIQQKMYVEKLYVKFFVDKLVLVSVSQFDKT